MKQKLRANKQAIRNFLRTEVWTVEKLCALLAHAQDKLSMWSCCCGNLDLEDLEALTEVLRG